jgi:hypothetical protein
MAMRGNVRACVRACDVSSETWGYPLVTASPSTAHVRAAAWADSAQLGLPWTVNTVNTLRRAISTKPTYMTLTAHYNSEECLQQREARKEVYALSKTTQPHRTSGVAAEMRSHAQLRAQHLCCPSA